MGNKRVRAVTAWCTVVVLLTILSFSTPTFANPLQEAHQALDSGQWQKAVKRFSQLSGPEKRLGLAQVYLTLGQSEKALQQLDGDSIPTLVLRMEALRLEGFHTDATETSWSK